MRSPESFDREGDPFFKDHLGDGSAGRKGGRNSGLLQTVPLLLGGLQDLQLWSCKNFGFFFGFVCGLVFLYIYINNCKLKQGKQFDPSQTLNHSSHAQH